jgi:dTDP-glucose 4,6-dehydratase
MNKKRILVTGSCGFLMSNFIRYLLKETSNYHIASIDAIKNPKLLNTIYANKGHTFYIGDITNEHFVKNIFEIERPDIIIHGAIENDPDVLKMINSNILGTQVLLDLSWIYGINNFIYISTDKVYGSLNTETDPKWTESSLINPINTYSVSKASAELFIKSASDILDLNYNILRVSNVYGPRQGIEYLIPKIVTNILNDQEVPIYETGAQIRDWLHVQDFCSALKLILEKNEQNQIYNVSSNQEYSNIEVFHNICNIMEKGHDLLNFVMDKPNHNFRYSMDSSKLRNLGWSPEFKLKTTGLNHTINWLNKNRWFIK